MRSESEWPRRVEAAVERYGLAPAVAPRLIALLELVRDDDAAPTTVRDPAVAVATHVTDSLAALELAPVRAARTLADLGAGAGFPGLPLACALPSADVWLVEATLRKCAFLRRAAERCGASNARVVCERAESWCARDLDVACARALAPLAVLVEYAAPLLRADGVLVAYKGRRDDGEEATAARAADTVGLVLDEVRPVATTDADHRHLHVYRKVRPTPPRFPRRPGRARKRPLGA